MTELLKPMIPCYVEAKLLQHRGKMFLINAVRKRKNNTTNFGMYARHQTSLDDHKAVIKNADMTEEMQQKAVDVASDAMSRYDIEKDIAAYLKKEFDQQYGATWHCIVGRNFGSYVTHETKHFIYFYMGNLAILLFKSG